MSETPDAELMARTARGDEGAFAELVVRHQDILLNFFLRKGVSYSDGQDLAQRTLLRLWRYRNRYAPTAKLTTFLFLLAGQVAPEQFRQIFRHYVAVLRNYAVPHIVVVDGMLHHGEQVCLERTDSPERFTPLPHPQEHVLAYVFRQGLVLEKGGSERLDERSILQVEVVENLV